MWYLRKVKRSDDCAMVHKDVLNGDFGAECSKPWREPELVSMCAAFACRLDGRMPSMVCKQLSFLPAIGGPKLHLCQFTGTEIEVPSYHCKPVVAHDEMLRDEGQELGSELLRSRPCRPAWEAVEASQDDGLSPHMMK